MPRLTLSWLFAATLFVPTYAFADDLLEDDEDMQESEEEKKAREAAEANRPKDADSIQDLLEDGEEIKALDSALDGENTTDLLGDSPESGPGAAAGQDTAAIYRDQQLQVADFAPDEELMAWDAYLERYPSTLFRERIDKRVEALNDLVYGEQIARGGPENLDANQQELPFAQGMGLEPLNPRTRLLAGFEWGLPSYMNLVLDYEKALKRDLSVHGGMRHRYTGWSFDGGVRYAVIKSVRTQSIVSLLGDVRFNANPAFAAVRPQIAAGKRFGDFDVQAQAGVEVETRPSAGVRVIGGANATYNASDILSMFAETQLYMGHLNWSEGPFRFNLAGFGMKFYPKIEGIDHKDIEVQIGASVPYTSNYWRYHFGAIQSQVNYYF